VVTTTTADAVARASVVRRESRQGTVAGRSSLVEEELAGQGGEAGFLPRQCGTGEAVEAGFGGGVPERREVDGGRR
jgi:hypothetical protein